MLSKAAKKVLNEYQTTIEYYNANKDHIPEEEKTQINKRLDTMENYLNVAFNIGG